MTDLPTLGQMLGMQARLRPQKIGVRDLERAMTFREWDRRACRLANALLGLGLGKGDRVVVLAYNRVEWAEIYAATSKAGLVAVPLNFRLIAAEAAFILQDCGAAAVLAEHGLHEVIEAGRDCLALPPDRFIHFGAAVCPAGWRGYEDLLARAAE